MNLYLKPALVMLALGLLSGISFAQRKTSFSLLSSSEVLSEQNTKTTTGLKYKKAKEIYDNLVEARGDRRFPAPIFTISKSEKHGAFLEADGLSIGLEEKLYDIMMKNGEREGEVAIAAILGHELTHYYEKHKWGSGFGTRYNDLKVARDIKSNLRQDTFALNYKLINETQSDYLGGFLAYSAGYPVYEGLPLLYTKFYREYNLPSKIEGYGDLSDRKLLANRSLEKLKELIEIFDMANWMTALGQYNSARSFYRHILFEYQSREIYNNLGLLTVLEAFNYMKDSEKRYWIPLEMDLNFGAGSRDGFGSADSIKVALLREALVYFENAVSLDSKYAPGYLNMACTHFLLGDYERALFYADIEAKQKAKAAPQKFPQTLHHADILKALILEKRGKRSEAIKILEQLKGDAAADHNLAVIKTGDAPLAETGSGPRRERIDGIRDPYEFYESLSSRQRRAFLRKTELFGALDFEVLEGVKTDENELKSSKVYACFPPSGDDYYVYIIITDPGYKGATRDDFQAGVTTLDEILEEYGSPKNRYKTTSGEFLVYRDTFFIVDNKQKLTRWAKYYLEEQ